MGRLTSVQAALALVHHSCSHEHFSIWIRHNAFFIYLFPHPEELEEMCSLSDFSRWCSTACTSSNHIWVDMVDTVWISNLPKISESNLNRILIRDRGCIVINKDWLISRRLNSGRLIVEVQSIDFMLMDIKEKEFSRMIWRQYSIALFKLINFRHTLNFLLIKRLEYVSRFIWSFVGIWFRSLCHPGASW